MSLIAIPVAALIATVGAWWTARWYGRRGYPPIILPIVAAVFDSRLVRRMSGIETLLRRAQVERGMRVLDAGCGPGRLTIPLARAVGDTGEVLALDVQQAMLDRLQRNVARERMTNVRTVRSALETAAALLAEEKPFDRILLVTVLGETRDSERALQSLFAVLKPQGILSVTETIIDPDYVPRQRAEQLATQAGFALLQRFGTPLAFTLNFTKPPSAGTRT